MHQFGDHMWFGMWYGWLFWIVIVGVVIWALVALAGRGSARREESALDILKKRYARGEISKEEFEAKKQDLQT